MNDPNWKFLDYSFSGGLFRINFIDVWKHEWTATGEQVNVKHPQYDQTHVFSVYEIRLYNTLRGDIVVRFAAGEFSNGVYGFYTEK